MFLTGKTVFTRTRERLTRARPVPAETRTPLLGL